MVVRLQIEGQLRAAPSPLSRPEIVAKFRRRAFGTIRDAGYRRPSRSGRRSSKARRRGRHIRHQPRQQRPGWGSYDANTGGEFDPASGDSVERFYRRRKQDPELEFGALAARAAGCEKSTGSSVAFARLRSVCSQLGKRLGLNYVDRLDIKPAKGRPQPKTQPRRTPLRRASGIPRNLVICLVAAVGLEPTTYGL